MLSALVVRHQAAQRLVASLLLSSCSSSLFAAAQQQQWQHQLSATYAAVPSLLSDASALSAALPGKSSLVVQYPFEIEYYSPRRTTLYNLDKQPLAALELPGDVFNVPVRIDILHQVVRWQQNKARQGTHKTKDRSEVSGGGKKPWQQKGSGRARQGSIRAPQWRGGGIVHGPVPRSYAFALPKKIRRLGLKCALSAKANEGRLIVLDSLKPELPKTKHMMEKLAHLLEGQPRINALLMDATKNGTDGGEAMRRAARNIPGVEIVPAVGANVYSILRRDVLIMTKPAVDAVIERLQRPINRLGAAGLSFQAKLQQRRRELAAAKRAEQLSSGQQHQQQQQDADSTAAKAAVAVACERLATA